ASPVRARYRTRRRVHVSRRYGMASDLQSPVATQVGHVGLAASSATVAAAGTGRLRPWLGLSGAAAVLAAAHVYALTLPWDQASPWVLANHLFAVGLLAGLLWLGAALGLRLLRILGLSDVLSLES